jgi:hypothetical protein
MAIITEHGIAERLVKMIKDPNANELHKDLACELHNLAVKRMQAIGEGYSDAVKAVLAQSRELRQAYRAYGHHGGVMSISMAILRGNRPDARDHDVSAAVVALVRDYMRRTGETNFSAATRVVLRENPQLAERYAKHTSA